MKKLTVLSVLMAAMMHPAFAQNSIEEVADMNTGDDQTVETYALDADVNWGPPGHGEHGGGGWDHGGGGHHGGGGWDHGGGGHGGGAGHGHRQVVCYAQNGRGMQFYAVDWNPGFAQQRALQACYQQSRRCRPLGCRAY